MYSDCHTFGLILFAVSLVQLRNLPVLGGFKRRKNLLKPAGDLVNHNVRFLPKVSAEYISHTSLFRFFRSFLSVFFVVPDPHFLICRKQHMKSFRRL